jgi:hypothetical protein
LPGIKTIAGVPMEVERVVIDKATIAAFFDELEGMIEDVPAAMLFNIGKSLYSECADAHEVRVLVPDSSSASSITIPFDRHTKRATHVGGIAGDGSTIKRMVIVEETGGYDSRHDKIQIIFISFLLIRFSQLFNEMS